MNVVVVLEGAGGVRGGRDSVVYCMWEKRNVFVDLPLCQQMLGTVLLEA